MNTAIASAPRRWFLISMLCIACNKDDGDAPPTTLAQAAAQADEATAKPTADPARPPIVAPAAGHVRVAALSTLVDKARNQLAPGALAGMVTTDALLDKLVETADQKELGKALDLDKAMASRLGEMKWEKAGVEKYGFRPARALLAQRASGRLRIGTEPWEGEGIGREKRARS